MKIQFNCSHEVMVTIHKELKRLGYQFLKDYDFEKQQDAWLQTTHTIVLKSPEMLSPRLKKLLFQYMI